MLDHQRVLVRERYAKIGAGGARSCCSDLACCKDESAPSEATKLGYSPEQLQDIPASSNMVLGCGNPLSIADIQEGERVLDLGSGGGIDCFLASQEVGPTGHVIGVDMTPEMLERARGAAQQDETTNVEFRLGEIEHLPVADQSVDVILSNCVINLSPDKSQVLREAHRVLKPGGRLAVMDVLATAPLPERLREDPDLLTGCIAGAASIDETRRMLEQAGFIDILIAPNESSRSFIKDWVPGSGIEASIISCAITARRSAASST